MQVSAGLTGGIRRIFPNSPAQHPASASTDRFMRIFLNFRLRFYGKVEQAWPKDSGIHRPNRPHIKEDTRPLILLLSCIRLFTSLDLKRPQVASSWQDGMAVDS
jgi:hypothetical protein